MTVHYDAGMNGEYRETKFESEAKILDIIENLKTVELSDGEDDPLKE